MAINLGSIYDLLLPGLRAVEGKYKEIPAQWPKVFESGKAKLAVERTASMRYLPLASLKNEGGPITFDNSAGQRYIYNQEHNEIALGYAITRKAIDDNLYKTQFNPSNLGLQFSFAQTKEIYAANVLNTATTYNTEVGGDGVAMCSTAHPIDGETLANRPSTDLSLNESAIESGLTQIRGFKDNAGLKIFARGKCLVVPPALEWNAIRLTQTELRPGTANNDVNATKSVRALPEGYMVMDFLTSPTSWFITTDKKGLLHLTKTAFEMDMQADFITQNLLVSGYERYSFNYYDWRAIWGSFPSS